MNDQFFARRARGICVVVGLAFLAGCGGGGGGGGDDTTSRYTGSTEPVAISSEAEADAVAGVATEAATQGDVTGGALSEVPELDTYLGSIAAAGETRSAVFDIADYALALSDLTTLDSAQSRLATRASQSYPCDAGGTISISESSESASLTFNACADLYGNTTNGSVVLTLQSSSQTSFTFTTRFNELTVTGVESILIDGSMQMTQTYNTDGSMSSRVSGTSFLVRNGTDELLLTNFDLREDEDPVTYAVTYEADYTIASTEIGGSVTVDTTIPFVEAWWDDYPSEGRLTVTGAGGAVVRLTVVDTTQVFVEYDLDGDGIYESSATLLWTDLE